jgi:hypothetical protein
VFGAGEGSNPEFYEEFIGKDSEGFGGADGGVGGGN